MKNLLVVALCVSLLILYASETNAFAYGPNRQGRKRDSKVSNRFFKDDAADEDFVDYRREFGKTPVKALKFHFPT